jgi:hypothetical protein
LNYFSVLRVLFGNIFIPDGNLRALRYEAAKKFSKRVQSTGVILLESDQVYLNQIAQYYSSGPLIDFYSSRIVSYRMSPLNFWTPISARIRHFLSLAYGFGSKKLILVNGRPSSRAKLAAHDLLDSVQSKSDLECLTVSGIVIGDLIYDRFLSTHQSATVDLQSKEFRNSFEESLTYFFQWLDFFSKNEVKAICISHCVYHYAIPARVAIQSDIPVYEITAGNIFKLDRSNLHSVVSHTALKKAAEKGLATNFQEVVSIGNREIANYLKPDEFKNPNLKALHSNEISRDLELKLNPSRITLLVATHLFYDAPHRFGVALFPDFFEWLEHLGQLSNKTDYNWLIKVHPDLPLSKGSIIGDVLTRYPRLKLVPTSTSHASFVKAGVDFVLTVHGSVGFEFPLLGVPVIGANPNAPYSNFGFSISPKSVAEYDDLIFGLVNRSKFIERLEVESFFYARFVTQFDAWLLKNYSQFLQDVGGMNNSMSKKVLKYFVSNPEISSTSELWRGLFRFFQSGDSVIQMSHFRTEA